MLRKCGLFVLSFAVLSTSLSVFFSGVSRAASPYDSTLVTTDSVVLDRSNYYGSTCSPRDITLNWASGLTNGFSGETVRPFDDGGTRQSDAEATRASFLNAINSSTGSWGVFTQKIAGGSSYSNGFNTSISVVWNEHGNLRVGFEGTSGDENAYVTNYTGSATITYYNGNWGGSQNCDLMMTGWLESSPTTYHLPISRPADSYIGYGRPQVLFMTPNTETTYPTGYAGEFVPNSPGSASVFPDIDYEVVGKTIKFKYNGNNVPFTPCSANWMITKTNYQPDNFEDNTFLGTLEDAWGGWQDLTGASSVNDSNNHVLDFRYKKSVTEQQTYTVDDYGNYYITLGLNTHWEGAPRLDCGDSGNKDDFGYDVRIKVVAIKIDGTTYAGTTDGVECGAGGGFCNGYANQNDKNPILKAFESLTNIQTFGLQAFLLAPINFVASLPSMANTCSPISFPLFGSSIQLQCLKPLYYSWSSTVMTIYTTLINAVVVYAVATKIFETIRNVSAPDKDRIEVVKL